MKIVLIHGKDTDPSKKWYPWLGKELKKTGDEFIAPVLPNSANPIMADWLSEIDKTDPDENTILIGHSRGGVTIMRWLEGQSPEKKVKRVVLVATNSGRLEDITVHNETNYGFYTNGGYDFKKIKSHYNDFVVFHSKDDKWVPFSAGKINATGLSAHFHQFDNYGHFGQGIDEIPELLEEILRQ